MTILEHLTPADVAHAIETHPRLSGAVRDIAAETGLPEDVIRGNLNDALTETLERLGGAYVEEMGGTLADVDRLRDQVHGFYDRVLRGEDSNPDTARLSSLFSELHEKIQQLSDPEAWARRRAESGAAPRTTPPEPRTEARNSRPAPESRPSSEPRDVSPEQSASASARSRADVIDRLVRRARSKMAQIDEALSAIEAEHRAAQRRVGEINRILRDRRVDLRQLADERFVSRLPEDLRALVDERAEAVETTRQSISDREALQRERRMWDRVSTSDVVQRRYAELRPRTPDGAARGRARAATVDCLGHEPTAANPFEPDHIVPVMEIVAMDGFVLLPDDVALEILNTPENFVPMNKAANASRSDWTWEEWPQWSNYTDAGTRSRMIDRENALRQEIQNRIQAAVARLPRAR